MLLFGGRTSRLWSATDGADPTTGLSSRRASPRVASSIRSRHTAGVATRISGVWPKLLLIQRLFINGRIFEQIGTRDLGKIQVVKSQSNSRSAGARIRQAGGMDVGRHSN